MEASETSWLSQRNEERDAEFHGRPPLSLSLAPRAERDMTLGRDRTTLCGAVVELNIAKHRRSLWGRAALAPAEVEGGGAELRAWTNEERGQGQRRYDGVRWNRGDLFL